MDDELRVRLSVNWLRHNKTSYDKHWHLMFDADGNETPLRKYINEILKRAVENKTYADSAVLRVNGVIKMAEKVRKQVIASAKAKNSEAKRARRRRAKQSRQIRKDNEKWAKGIRKYNEKIEAEENKIHLLYRQIMLSKVGLADVQLRKKLLPKH